MICVSADDGIYFSPSKASGRMRDAKKDIRSPLKWTSPRIEIVAISNIELGFFSYSL
jgi:hypothetical protein